MIQGAVQLLDHVVSLPDVCTYLMTVGNNSAAMR